MMNDTERVLAAIAAGRKDDAVARVIASMYHRGQSSKSYSFVSTGFISSPDNDLSVQADEALALWKEMFSDLSDDVNEINIAGWMAVCLLDRLALKATGKVDGWSDLWL